MNKVNVSQMNSIDEELEMLSRMSDEEIDLSDIPQLDFNNAERGRFYRPIKQSVTLRLDSDIVAWFKLHHPKYQTAINKILREHISTIA